MFHNLYSKIMKTLNFVYVVASLAVLLSGAAVAKEGEMILSQQSQLPQSKGIDCHLDPVEKTLLLKLKVNDDVQADKLVSFFVNPCFSKIDKTGFMESLGHNFVEGFHEGSPIISKLITGYSASFEYNIEEGSIFYKVEYTYPSGFVQISDEFTPLTSTLTASGFIKDSNKEGELFKMRIGDTGEDLAELTYQTIN
ncbi:hypothetical protein OTK49_01710 [Vibrio coralliirubri]|uniref:hypothetical protein n=1 Tax=Vibrio coralliirubri TaxID=1516159 RepID=UPI00228532E5|nr:hypothetical protein [Vibrio coralliirubri]MCY9861229.1 hypothetical protein [Vibrio coralliirubri]